MEQSTEENPIEILVQQNKILQELNKKLLDYYDNTAPLILEKNEQIPYEIQKVFQSQKEQFKTILAKNIEELPQIKMDLSERDRSILTDTQNQIKSFTKLSNYFIGLLLLALAITFISGYFANRFYKTSVLTKTEIRKEFLDEVEYHGEMITSKEYHQALENEKIVLSQFFGKHKNFRDLYASYRDGIIENNKTNPFFKNPISDEILPIDRE